jgi:hypothetical protein
MKQDLSKYLPREPRFIDDHDWFYIEPKGIVLVHETLTGNGVIADQILISWQKINRAVDALHAAEQL